MTSPNRIVVRVTRMALRSIDRTSARPGFNFVAPTLGAALIALALVMAACGGGSTSTTSGASATTPGASAAQSASTIPVTSPPASAAAGAVIRSVNRGLEVTLPSDWLALTPDDVADAAKLTAFRAVSPAQAKNVDAIVNNLKSHPEYWVVALHPASGSALTGQIREFADLATWKAQQQAALEQAYGTVESRTLTKPRDGISFTWAKDGIASRLDAYVRPGGAVLFTFVGPTAAANGSGWDDAIATFTDAGT